MTTDDTLTFDGGCTCRAVRYRLSSRPLFVHCCHCRWCQRETGASFALNAMIEADRVLLLQGQPEVLYELVAQHGCYLLLAAALPGSSSEETLLLPLEHTVERPKGLPPEARPTRGIALIGREPGKDIEHPRQSEDDLLDVRVLYSRWQASDDSRLTHRESDQPPVGQVNCSWVAPGRYCTADERRTATEVQLDRQRTDNI